MKIGAHQIPKFDPFNMTGLPDHILTQVLDDYFFWYNDYAMREEFKLIDSYINKRRENHTPDPMLKEWLDQGLISQNQYDQVALLRGGPSDVYSGIFASPISGYSVVPPDRMVPIIPETHEDHYIFAQHQYDKLKEAGYITESSNVSLRTLPAMRLRDARNIYAPGSMDRLKHYEEGALDRTIKGGEFLPKVTAYAVGEDGVKRDLRDIDFMSILTGPVKGDYIPHDPIPETNLCPEVYGIEGEHLDGEVDRIMQKSGLLGENGMLDLFKVAALSKRNVPIEGELVSPVMDLDENLNRRNYGILIRESLDSEGNVEYHLGEPKEKPLEGQIVDKGVEVRVIPDDYEFPPHVSKPGDGYKLDHSKNPLREHWEKYGDPYEGRLPQPTPEQQVTIDQLLAENVDPGLAERVKRRIRRESLGDLEDISDVGLPPVVATPEEIADAEQAMQEAADGKLDYLLEGTQWDPKLRK